VHRFLPYRGLTHEGLENQDDGVPNEEESEERRGKSEKKRLARLRGELKEDDQEEEEDWDPDSILKVCYTNEDKGEFMFGTKGQYKVFTIWPVSIK